MGFLLVLPHFYFRWLCCVGSLGGVVAFRQHSCHQSVLQFSASAFHMSNCLFGFVFCSDYCERGYVRVESVFMWRLNGERAQCFIGKYFAGDGGG